MPSSGIVLQLAAIVLLFFAGMLLRRLRVLDARHGARLLKVVVWVGLPALIFATVSRLPLNPQHFWLPTIAMTTMLLSWPVASAVGRMLALDRKTLGAFVICSMVLNIGFEYPFVLVALGAAGFSELALFDLGNALILCTVGYLAAARFGGKADGWSSAVKRLASFPPLWALMAALIVNTSVLEVPAGILDVLEGIGRWVVLLVLVALGILFDSRRARSRPVLLAVGLRVGLGVAIGVACAALLDLQGVTRTVAILGSAAPIGFNVVVLAQLESLDTEFAASAASLSVLLGLVYVPAALLFLR